MQTLRQLEAALTLIWAELLDRPPPQIGPDDNFFSIGGDSLLIVRAMDRVNTTFFAECPDNELPIADFFTHGTIRQLASRIASRSDLPEEKADGDGGGAGGEIAIIGMAGRFPGADNLATFWANLKDGVESLRSLSNEELANAGVPEAERTDPRYVARVALLDGVRTFDAEYFGLSASEAAITSPDQRLLLECSQEALDDGGYGVVPKTQRVGVFVGASLSSYLIERAGSTRALESAAGMRLLSGNTSHATRVSYLLNLTGPSITLDTACSSSLVAVHQACRSLQQGECELALAGGATVRRFEPRGYCAEEGGIFSPDGHCRPFDEAAAGTIGSSGAGMVLLKRLEQARADGDAIYAIIRGSAINNDGNAKVGYTAPSAAGQASAIGRACSEARLDPSTIQYVETHGTATALGDVIEIAALNAALGGAGRKPGTCALGTLKANIGHTEAAAGVASLIKATLALKNRQIPPAIHFRTPHPKLELAKTPFYVNAALLPWARGDTPRRCGVSSFGIGGTNAHVVLEEAVDAEAPSAELAGPQVLVLSARSRSALQRLAENLAARLEADPQLRLADVAFTLQNGRRTHAVRECVVCQNLSDAVRQLRDLAAGRAGQDCGDINSGALDAAAHGRRVSLPSYPFERREHWVEPSPSQADASRVAAPTRQPMRDWFYVPIWKQKPTLRASAAAESECCLVFEDSRGVSQELVRRLATISRAVIRVQAGDEYSLQGNVAIVNPADEASCSRLMKDLEDRGLEPDLVIHAWQLLASGEQRLSLGLHSVMQLCAALGESRSRSAIRLLLVTQGAHTITGDEESDPYCAVLPAIAAVVSQEFPNIDCRSIDVALPEDAGRAREIVGNAILTELNCARPEPLVAWRGRSRWVRSFERLPPERRGDGGTLLRNRGTYLITGGLGGIGLTLALHLARRVGARLVLTSRSAFAERSEWRELSARHDDVGERARQLLAIEEAGGEVRVVAADVTDPADMRAVVEQVLAERGALNGVIHCAGVAGGGVLALKTAATVRGVIAPKIAGTAIVHDAVKAAAPDFFVCCSSIASVLAPAGQSDYCAANAFQDAFAHAHDGRGPTRFISINWDAWKSVGMAVRSGSAAASAALAEGIAHGIACEEGAEVFDLILENPRPQWIVSTRELAALQQARHSRRPAVTGGSASREDSVRDWLGGVWSELLGVPPPHDDDDFFELGGDSLLAIQLSARVESRFGQSLPLRQLMSAPTLAGLSQLLQPATA